MKKYRFQPMSQWVYQTSHHHKSFEFDSIEELERHPLVKWWMDNPPMDSAFTGLKKSFWKMNSFVDGQYMWDIVCEYNPTHEHVLIGVVYDDHRDFPLEFFHMHSRQKMHSKWLEG